jgi:hypothetical protein
MSSTPSPSAAGDPPPLPADPPAIDPAAVSPPSDPPRRLAARRISIGTYTPQWVRDHLKDD